jgi:perosamine synthetase
VAEQIRQIPPFKIDLGFYKEEILAEIGKVIDSGRLILGPYTQEIEERWAKDHGKKFGLAVNSDTAALECVLQALSIKRTLVLMPQTAHFSCANIVLRLGGYVGLVDVDPTKGIMPTMNQWNKARAWLQNRDYPEPSVVMMVYSAGQCSPTQVQNIEEFQNIGIPVLEDCAHCHGAKYADGRLIGSAGDFATWSTYATKILHSGEGGMIVTSDPIKDELMNGYRNYGPKINDGVFTEVVNHYGYNWRMTEFQAAILKVMYNHLPEMIKARKAIADQCYAHFFPEQNRDRSNGRPYRLHPGGGVVPNLYRYTVMIPGMTFDSNRSLYSYLKGRGIILQEKCNHLPLSMHRAYTAHPYVIPASRSFYGALQYSLEHICLPIYPDLTFRDAEFIAVEVLKWWKENQTLLRR